MQLLVAGHSVSSVAKQIGVRRETVHAWRNQPLFRQAMHEAEADAINELSRQLTRLATSAVHTFASVLADPDATAALKLRAADKVLAHLFRARELSSLEDRVLELEAKAIELKTPN